MKKNRTVEIDEEFIQMEAEVTLERCLSSYEYDKVVEEICGNLTFLVQDAIDKVICLADLIENNKDAENIFPHYKVLHRNENAFMPTFETVITVSEEGAARHFIEDHNIINEFDEWQIFCVEQDGTEKCVHAINC